LSKALVRFLQLRQHTRLTAAGTHPLRRGPSRRSRRASLDQAVDIRRHVYGHNAPRRQRRCVRQADSQHSVVFFSGTRSAAAPSRARPRMAAVVRPYNNSLTLPPSERCAASPPLPRSEPQPLHATGKERGRRRAIAPKRSKVPALVAVAGLRRMPCCACSPLGGTSWPSALLSASLTLDRARRVNGQGVRVVQRVLEGPHACICFVRTL
jgi:hypothetical protein